VIATYNRSNILRLALESLRRSSLGDWEAQVIGDGCTDDTESIVEQMGDDRIHFHNLPQNFGEQSRPNNVGCERARGRYVAFLNHDDLYFPDHLETSVDVIEKTDADLVFSASLRAPPRTPEQLKAGEWRFSFGSCPAGKKYLPYTFVSASRWLMKRELIQAIGPWKPAVSCYGAPSQDFLFRAWKRGKLLSFKPRATVLTMSSSTRVKA
jgi:glycosyltransferase involved in cell wall biosynthesis